MKINNIDTVYPQPVKHGPRAAAGDNGFSNVFAHEIASTDEVRKTTPSTLPFDHKTEVLTQGDRILTLLEDYASDLNSPGKELKQMEPLVATIQDELSRIQQTVDDPSVDDPSLQNLVDELSVTADVAIFKFYRGDFV